MEYKNIERVCEIRNKIVEFKTLLSQSDYKALKHADGALTDEEYKETRLKRAKFREKINELEAELESLKIS